jgi:hypothetical protein
MMAKFSECINPNLLKVIEAQLLLIVESPSQERNALTTLFGKDSLKLSGFHHMMQTYSLTFIFGLNELDKRFLDWIKTVFIQKEWQQPGWSRPCASNIIALEYISLMLLHVYRSMHDQPINEKVKRIKEIASRCLNCNYVASVIRLIIEINNYLDTPQMSPSQNRGAELCELFGLRSFYQVRLNEFSYYGAQAQISPSSCSPLNTVSL